MAPLKVGIIRLSANGSWAARSHLPYFQKSEKYKITALQNSSAEAAKKAVTKYQLAGTVACYAGHEELAADPNVDLVVVTVKVPEHAKLASPVIAAGKDIFVEWPLARNLEEAEKLVLAASSAGVRAVVGLQARHNPSIIRAREMVQAGELGDILGTTMTGSGIIVGPTITESFLYGCPIENGANLVTIPAGHAIDALCFVLGEWKYVEASLGNHRPEVPLVDASGNIIRQVKKTSHDWASITGQLVLGGIATVIYKGGVSETGRNFYWEINGTKGSLVLEADSGHVQMFHPRLSFARAVPGAKLETVMVEVAEDFSYNVGKAWDKFADGLGDGPATFEDALIRHKMIDAIYRSDASGARTQYL